MIVNAYSKEGRDLIVPIPGTHIVAETFGVIGRQFVDPSNQKRIWTVQALYTPVAGRALGGLRAKVFDQKAFFSFVNQRDLEILLNLASPETYCDWLDQDYPEPGDPTWIGLGVDDQDLFDDLLDRELEARALQPPDIALPSGLSFDRRVHDGAGNDYIETMMLLHDMNMRTGEIPDTCMDTLENRWVSVERTAPIERRRLWTRS